MGVGVRVQGGEFDLRGDGGAATVRGGNGGSMS